MQMLRVMLLAGVGCMVAAAFPAARGEVTVSAAASLTDVLQQIAKLYEWRTGERLVLNFAASNTLARQINAGARIDVFISADVAQMDAVASRIVAGSRKDLLSNQLAIAVPDDRPRSFASVRDLLDPGIRRIAVGDPAAVPAGVYAKAYLERLGIWADLASRIVPTGSVRLALAAVENGAADAAIVYRTDIAAAGRAREALVIPLEEGPPIRYPAAAIRGGANPEGAQRLLAFFDSPEAVALFKRAGFVPLGPRRRLHR
jgi:molybdate transport system substrate-binding protein